jgi:hypothetical protein
VAARVAGARVTLRETFEGELGRLDIRWCVGGCRYRNSHRRGFATPGTVHLASKIGTRRSLYGGLHEVGHVALGHVGRRGGKRRWQVEAEAEAWAQQRMRELGIEVPEEQVEAGRAYIARMRRWGDNISRA